MGPHNSIDNDRRDPPCRNLHSTSILLSEPMWIQVSRDPFCSFPIIEIGSLNCKFTENEINNQINFLQNHPTRMVLPCCAIATDRSVWILTRECLTPIYQIVWICLVNSPQRIQTENWPCPHGENNPQSTNPLHLHQMHGSKTVVPFAGLRTEACCPRHSFCWATTFRQRVHTLPRQRSTFGAKYTRVLCLAAGCFLLDISQARPPRLQDHQPNAQN